MLENVNLKLKLSRAEYEKQLDQLQTEMSFYGFQVYAQQRPVVIAFEGWDAAGKGGCIKRATSKLDPRGYTVWPIEAPHGEDKSHQYLYRFWRRLPEKSRIAIFDRSWYGRVLVERVEGFCEEEEWKRAYREINEFERQLYNFGTIVVKFWLHLSKKEQLRRYQERRRDPNKQFKLTPDDWRNREKWDQYWEAVEEMLLRTSTLEAPWHIIEAEDKYWARVKVLKILVDKLRSELKDIKRSPG
jgi:polyphosphate kinase 2 (PPK2 family)